MSNNPAKYEVLIKQYLHSILDTSESHNLWNEDVIITLILLSYFKQIVG